jgi:multicomponent Na+:H+ antiporter subunit C
MTVSLAYALTGVALISMGFYALVVYPNLIRKLLAINVSGAGVFLFLVAAADSAGAKVPDPVPHAMVLTGIVVAVSATALGLVLANRIYQLTGSARLPDPDTDGDS